ALRGFEPRRAKRWELRTPLENRMETPIEFGTEFQETKNEGLRDIREAAAEESARRPSLRRGSGKSIAVLPFAHAGGPGGEYYTDGFPAELRTTLARLDGLRVAARRS